MSSKCALSLHTSYVGEGTAFVGEKEMNIFLGWMIICLTWKLRFMVNTILIRLYQIRANIDLEQSTQCGYYGQRSCQVKSSCHGHLASSLTLTVAAPDVVGKLEQSTQSIGRLPND